jgi:hypothetical protein
LNCLGCAPLHDTTFDSFTFTANRSKWPFAQFGLQLLM